MNSNLDFQMRLQADVNDFKQQMKQAQLAIEQLKNASQEPNKNQTNISAARTAAKEIEQIEKTLNASIAAETKRLVKLKQQAHKDSVQAAKTAAKERITQEKAINQAMRQLRRVEVPKVNLKPMVQEIRAIGNEADLTQTKTSRLFDDVKRGAAMFTGFAAAEHAISSVKNAISETLATVQEFQSIGKRFEYAFSGVEQGAQEFAFAREQANHLGLEVKSVANGYAQFAAATKDLNITQNETREIFQGVANASAAMGLSADETSGVILALSQIAGKGKVSMEELRGQLGERLTPAMSIAAQSMGVTTAELEKMVEAGLSAEVFLPKFGAALNQAFGETAAKNADTLNGKINHLKNQLTDLMLWVGENGLTDLAKNIFDNLGEAVETTKQSLETLSQSDFAVGLKETFRDVENFVVQLGESIAEMASGAWQNLSDLGQAINEAFGLENADNAVLIEEILGGLCIVVGALQDGFKGLVVAFHAFSAVGKQAIAGILGGASMLVRVFNTDLSDSLARGAEKMQQSADDSFNKMRQKALEFESSTQAAMSQTIERIVTAHKNSLQQTKNAAQETHNAIVQTSQQTSQVVQNLTEQVGLSTEKQLAAAQNAASALGVNVQAASNSITQTTQQSLTELNKIIQSFDLLQKNGVQVARVLQESLNKITEKAQNAADVEAIKQKWQELGQSGKLAMQDVEAGILAADIKLQELRSSIDPTEAAFKKLGIASRESMRISAEQMRQAFETIKQSGQASAENLKTTFAKTANAMLQSGDDSQKAWVQSQAAVYGYTVQIDKTGKAALAASQTVQQATKQQINAYDKVAQAAQNAAQSSEKSTQKSYRVIKQSTDSLTRAIAQEWKKFGPHTHILGGLGVRLHNQLVTEMSQRYKATQQSVANLNAAMQNGNNLGKQLAVTIAQVDGNAQLLDQSTLANFRQAIAQAQAQMKALSDEAQAAKQSAEEELLQVLGKTDELQKRQHQAKIAQLQTKLQEAKRQGNSQAVNDYQATIDTTQRIYRAKKYSQMLPENTLPESTVNVNQVDVSSLTRALHERDQQIVQNAQNALINQLTQAVKAQR